MPIERVAIVSGPSVEAFVCFLVFGGFLKMCWMASYPLQSLLFNMFLIFSFGRSWWVVEGIMAVSWYGFSALIWTVDKGALPFGLTGWAFCLDASWTMPYTQPNIFQRRKCTIKQPKNKSHKKARKNYYILPKFCIVISKIVNEYNY